MACDVCLSESNKRQTAEPIGHKESLKYKHYISIPINIRIKKRHINFDLISKMWSTSTLLVFFNLTGRRFLLFWHFQFYFKKLDNGKPLFWKFEIFESNSHFYWDTEQMDYGYLEGTLACDIPPPLHFIRGTFNSQGYPNIFCRHKYSSHF